MTPNQQITSHMFQAFDANQDGFLTWSEWQKFVKVQDGHSVHKQDFWTAKRMDFNFIDFDRDDKISKKEYQYYLDNFIKVDGIQSLVIIKESRPQEQSIDPMIILLAIINLIIVAVTAKHVFKGNKKRDDGYRKKMNILV